VGQVVERGPVESAVERVLVAVPEAGRGAASVAEGVDVEVAEFVRVWDQFGESGGGSGVIDIPLLPKACHDEVVFYDKSDNFLLG